MPKQLVSSSSLARTFDLIKDPGQLCSGEIGVEEASLFRYHGFLAGIFHRCADVGGPSVLPDYGIVDRLAVSAVPDDSRLPLIGDAYRNRETAARPRLGYYGCRYIDGCLPDILWVMFNPAIRREMLRKLS